MSMTAVETLEPNEQEVREFLDFLFGGDLGGRHDGVVEIAWTSSQPDRAGRHPLCNARTFGTDELDEAAELVLEQNRIPGQNLYVGAALRKPGTIGRGGDEDFYALPALYADLDEGDAVRAAKERYAACPPSRVAITGLHPDIRAQMWWRLEEPITDPDRAREQNSGLAQALEGDPSVVNPGRVMRIPGTIAWPNKPGRIVERTEFKTPASATPIPYMIEEIARRYPPTDGAATSATIIELEDHRREATGSLGLQTRIEDGRERYMRDTLCACLIEWCGEYGTAPTVEELAESAWPQYSRSVDFGRAGRGKDEFIAKARYTVRRFEMGRIRGARTIEEAIRSYRAKSYRKPVAPSAGLSSAQPVPEGIESSDTPRFRFEKTSDLRALPPIAWLVHGWFPDGATGILFGKWAAGKSFIGFDLALHLAYGLKDWHGASLPGEPCDVLVISREGHQGFVQRIDAFKRHHGISQDTERLTFMRQTVSLMRDDEFAAFCREVQARGERYRLVLIDTVARVLPGVDLNAPETVTLFMERCAILAGLTGATAIGVHHQNKTGSMMGSTYFEANADFVFEVSRDGDEEGPLESGQLFCAKQKDAEDRWRRSVRYKKIGLSLFPDGPSSLVVDSISEGQERKIELPPKDVCRRILYAIDEAWKQRQPLSHMHQAKAAGRYAQRILSDRFEVSPDQIEHLIRAWIDNAIVSFEIMDKNAKKQGLKVVGTID